MRGGVGAGNARGAEMRRKAFLGAVRNGHTVKEALKIAGWSDNSTYHQNRKKWPQWAADVDAATGFTPNTRQSRPRTNDSHHGGPSQKPGHPLQVYGQRDNFLTKLRSGLTVPEASAAVGWTSTNTYRKHRSLEADFAQEVDGILAARKLPGAPAPTVWTAADGFAGFRKTFLGHDSPWFHLMAIEAMNTMPGGSVLMILWPPRAGKTSLWEDVDTFLLATEPGTLITIGSEKIAQATKITRAVRDRLDHDAPGMGLLRERFGPFAPPRGKDKLTHAQQSWGVQAFNVAKKPRGKGAQRDFNMQAIGMRASIIGTRCDLLQVDDPQSRNSLLKEANTDQLIETFRQDWLSRPGPEGRTVLLGNRVGEGDFWQVLKDNTDIVDRIITVPAWDPERGGWLWPEMYTPEYYKNKRAQVGEDAWNRNYMQIGVGRRNQTFTEPIIAKAKNDLRSVMHPTPRPPDGGETSIVISVDPGKYKASFHVGALHPDRFVSLDIRLLENAKTYGVYGDVIDELCMQFHRPGLAVVSTVIVETMAFQYALLQDDRLLAAQKRWSFELMPFETGRNKYDPDFGIPQTARMMEHGEIDFPNGDEQSEARYKPLYDQLKRWRPGVRGNRLEQDHVMTMWIACQHWKLQRRTLGADADSSQFNFR